MKDFVLFTKEDVTRLHPPPVPEGKARKALREAHGEITRQLGNVGKALGPELKVILEELFRKLKRDRVSNPEDVIASALHCAMHDRNIERYHPRCQGSVPMVIFGQVMAMHTKKRRKK